MAPPPFRRSLSVDTDHSEDGGSNLSDSTYEIVSQSSINTSDDEYHFDDGTESVAFDDDNADGNARNNAVEGEGPTNSLSYLINHDPSEPPSQVESSIETQLLIPSLSTSRIEESTLRDEPIPEPDSVSFDEYTDSDGNIYGSCVHDVPSTSTADGFTTVAIHQSMSAKYMKLDRPLRVFYWGPLSLKDVVTEKLAHIIAASAQFDAPVESSVSSKLSIVPMATSGTVMLIPASGYEIVVQNITGYVRASKKGWINTDPITLSTSSDTNKPSRPNDFKKPDLAIFVYSERDIEQTLDEEPSVSVPLSFHLRGLGVPVIHVADSLKAYPLQPSKELIETVLGPGSLHVRSMAIPHDDQYPVSLRTFLSINDGQLNRHLSYLTGLCDQTPVPAISFSGSGWPLTSRRLLSNLLNVILMFGGVLLAGIGEALLDGGTKVRAFTELLQQTFQVFYSKMEALISSVVEDSHREVNEHQEHIRHHDALSPSDHEISRQIRNINADRTAFSIPSTPVLIAIGMLIPFLAGVATQFPRSVQPVRPEITKSVLPVVNPTHAIGALQPSDHKLDPTNGISDSSSTVDVPIVEIAKSEVSSIASDIQKAIATKAEQALIVVTPIPVLGDDGNRANRGLRLFKADDGRLFLHLPNSLSKSKKLKKRLQVSASQADSALPVELTQINKTTFELHIPATQSMEPTIISVLTDKTNIAPVTFQVVLLPSSASTKREGDPMPGSLAFEIESLQKLLRSYVHSATKAQAKTFEDMRKIALARLESMQSILATHGKDIEKRLHQADLESTKYVELLKEFTRKVPQLRSLTDIRQIAYREFKSVSQKLARAIQIGSNKRHRVWLKVFKRVKCAKDAIQDLSSPFKRTDASFEGAMAETKPWSILEYHPVKRAHERAASVLAKIVRAKRGEERRRKAYGCNRGRKGKPGKCCGTR